MYRVYNLLKYPFLKGIPYKLELSEISCRWRHLWCAPSPEAWKALIDRVHFDIRSFKQFYSKIYGGKLLSSLPYIIFVSGLWKRYTLRIFVFDIPIKDTLFYIFTKRYYGWIVFDFFLFFSINQKHSLITKCMNFFIKCMINLYKTKSL